MDFFSIFLESRRKLNVDTTNVSNGSFSSFLILSFFTILVSPGTENTILVRNCICWNLSFCDSHIEEMTKTGTSFCNLLFWEKQCSILSSSLNRKPPTCKRVCHIKNLRFCSVRQNHDIPVMRKSAIIF